MSATALLCLACLVIIVVWRINANRRFRQDARTAREEQIEADAEADRVYDARVRDFEQASLADWPHQFPTSLQRARRYLMFSADRKRLRYVQVTRSPKNVVAADHQIAISEIVSVEVQQNSEVVTSYETRTEIKKQGALGRAIVGGVLLGGAGAIVGAASAGSRAASTTVATSETRLGTVYLLICTADIVTPVIKISMPSRAKAEDWLHRIRACVAFAANNQDD